VMGDVVNEAQGKANIKTDNILTGAEEK